MVGLKLVAQQKKTKNCKKNIWLWEFVYHIDMHATIHECNLPNKKIVLKNQNDIKSLNIPKNSID
jgi:hypothetical protein